MQSVLSGLFGRNTPQAAGVEIAQPVVSAKLALYYHDTLGAWGLCLVLTQRQGEMALAVDFLDQALTWRGGIAAE